MLLDVFVDDFEKTDEGFLNNAKLSSPQTVYTTIPFGRLAANAKEVKRPFDPWEFEPNLIFRDLVVLSGKQ